MSKKQQLIDFVLGNDFIVKPSLRNQFELMLNDAICESSSNWISVNESGMLLKLTANVLRLCEGKGLEALNFKLSTND